MTPSSPRLWTNYPGDSQFIDGNEFIMRLPERACGCHPAMPVERVPGSPTTWACKGCGVHSS